MTDVAKDTAELIPVRTAHRFDIDRLTDYLTGRLEGFAGAVDVQQMRGGQSNPTFLIASGGHEWVLRKQPPGKLLPSAHAVDREYRIQMALAGSDVPVARMDLYCDDAEVIGTPFYIMERMRGRIFHDNRVPGVSPSERTAIFDAMNETLAHLHKVDWQALGLEDFGRPGNYFARQLRRWTKQWLASKQSEIAEMDRLIAWLPDHLPGDETTTIVHGDFRLGNLMVHLERPEIIAVFDWELSTLGNPLADFGYNCMIYEVTPDLTSAMAGFAGIDIAALGIPSRAEYADAYFRRLGRDPVDPTFYIAFAMFRSAAIVEGVLARAVAGNAASDDARRIGAAARPLAKRAWELIQENGLA